MNKREKTILAAAEKYARSIIGANTNGHDWHHIERVRNMAARIARAEKVDPFLPELMALLHDLHDRKVVGYGKEKQALAATRRWLAGQPVSPVQLAEVMYVITHQSYAASGITGKKLSSPAGRIMQDADRLDAIGALGIARCFVFSGERGNLIYDPAIPPRQRQFTVQEYKQDRNTAINHFYEKMLKLKDLMNTRTGKRIAQRRHTYMKKFLAEFFAEWRGQR